MCGIFQMSHDLFPRWEALITPAVASQERGRMFVSISPAQGLPGWHVSLRPESQVLFPHMLIINPLKQWRCWFIHLWIRLHRQPGSLSHVNSTHLFLMQIIMLSRAAVHVPIIPLVYFCSSFSLGRVFQGWGQWGLWRRLRAWSLWGAVQVGALVLWAWHGSDCNMAVPAQGLRRDACSTSVLPPSVLPCTSALPTGTCRSLILELECIKKKKQGLGARMPFLLNRQFLMDSYLFSGFIGHQILLMFAVKIICDFNSLFLKETN